MDIAGEVRIFCWGHQNIDYPLKTLRTAPYKKQLYSYLPPISLGREEKDLMDIAGNVRMFCWGTQNFDYPLKTAPYKNQHYEYLPPISFGRKEHIFYGIHAEVRMIISMMLCCGQQNIRWPLKIYIQQIYEDANQEI